MADRYTFETVWGMDGGAVSRGNDSLRALMARAFSTIPMDAVDLIMESCLILCPENINSGEYIPASLLKDKSVVLLNPEIWDLSDEEQIRILLHETAHFLLGHKLGQHIDAYLKQEGEA
jgi:hypothetical protein